jgi:glycosyltransferase involved in cell wall biosynthesis
MDHRPHVVMFLTGEMPFGHDWAMAARRAAKVTLVERYRTAKQRSSIPEREGCRYVSVGVVTGFRPKRLFGRAMAIAEALVLRRALHRIEADVGRVDLLHSHFYVGAEPISHLAAMMGIGHVHTEHSSAFCREQKEPGRTISRHGARVARRVFDRAGRVLMVSSYLEGEVRRSIGFANGVVVPNPVDICSFSVRQMPPWNDSIRLIHVGRLSPEKGLVELLDGFAVAAARDRRLSLSLVGDGPQEGVLRARAASLGITDRVQFAGRRSREEIPSLLGGSHIYVSNSAVETFGVAVAEALAVGRIAVAPGHCALPEVVGDAGVFFRHGDRAALVEAIERAVLLLPEWDAGERHTQAAGRFGAAAVAEKLERIYVEVADGRGSTR